MTNVNINWQRPVARYKVISTTEGPFPVKDVLAMINSISNMDKSKSTLDIDQNGILVINVETTIDYDSTALTR